jgi:hypothetical protein
MQFMSRSLGWADNILLAMAPLGIITIIVAAIRVSGQGWMKAIIGRSRETLGSAEMELMSSTSKEVCELWNDENLVRVIGKAPVREFVVLGASDPKNAELVSAKLSSMACEEDTRLGGETSDLISQTIWDPFPL